MLISFADKRIKIGLIGLLSVVIIFFGFLTWNNRVQRAEQDIQLFWQLLDRACAERLALLPQFAQVVESLAPDAQAIVQPLVSVYHEQKDRTMPFALLSDPGKLQDLRMEQQKIALALSYMQQRLPANVNQDPRYQELLKSLDEKELRMEYIVHALTKKIVIYNRLTYELPQRWVNRVFTHYPPMYFPEIPTMEGHEPGR